MDPTKCTNHNDPKLMPSANEALRLLPLYEAGEATFAAALRFAKPFLPENEVLFSAVSEKANDDMAELYARRLAQLAAIESWPAPSSGVVGQRQAELKALLHAAARNSCVTMEALLRTANTMRTEYLRHFA